jgi:hypothetical protein
MPSEVFNDPRLGPATQHFPWEFFGFLVAGMILLLIWSLIWRGMALWKAAREGSKVWFIVLLVVNTVGILDILYLYVFSKKKGVPAVEAPKEEGK